jgi:hypothetical protein
VDSQEWAWCFNYLLILVGISSVILLLSGEETIFAREAFKAEKLNDIEGLHNTGIASEHGVEGGKRRKSTSITSIHKACTTRG